MSATGTPTGSVTFIDGSITLGTRVLGTRGKATLRTKALPAGQDSVTAIYSGDSHFDSSTSVPLIQNVSQDGTTTTIVSSANPSRFGQMLTMTITIKAATPGSGVPTGTVTIFDGSTSLGTVNLNSGGRATLATRALGVGTHTIMASYAGDSNFTLSSTTLTQTVYQDKTTTTVASSANPSHFGQPVKFTATVRAVAPGSGVPTGTVTFYDGSTPLGTAPLYGSGQATISIATLSVGTHTITASYSGDGNFSASATAALTQTVNQAATKTTGVSSANPSGTGQPVTFTATVATLAPGIGIPTGTVTFSINGTPQTPVALTVINGVDEAVFTTTLTTGTYTITAVYSGDLDFGTSSASHRQKVK